jgi:hypothetical protein
MKSRIFWSVAVVCLLARPAAAQPFSVSQPTGSTNIKAADDFATRAFQDPWDMNQRTDLGWWLYGTDAPGSNFANPTFSGGIFSATMSGGTGRLFLLDSDLVPEAPAIATVPTGKTGGLYPIDATKYTHLVYRMSSSVAGVSQYMWSNKTIYQDQTLGVEVAQNQTAVQTGWKIYDVDMTKLTAMSTGLGSPFAWGNTIRALQFLPNAGSSSAAIQLDWVRLVQVDTTTMKQIVWTGGPADIYLDSDNNAANGTLGRIAVNASSPYNFFVGGLPAGTYYVAVHAHTTGETLGSAGGFSYSPGSWTVNDIPTVTFTTPSDEGSSDDFATTKLGTPWLGGSPSFLDTTLVGFGGKENVVNDGPAGVALTNEAGVSLGTQTVYLGTGINGDPQVFPLFWDGKGKQTKIDPTHYRILTVDVGLPNLARSLPGGSIGRVIWRAAAETQLGADGLKAQDVTEQFMMNSAAGENTLAHVTMDLNNVQLVQGDTSTTWNSPTARSLGIESFRWDPHEFSSPTNFYVKRIKLAALERTQGDQFTFKWTSSKVATIQVFYDQDSTHSFTLGNVACQVTNAPAGAGSCTWNAGAVPNGEYQIYASINDGTNLNEVYARTNVIVDHSNNTQAVSLDKQNLYYAQLGPIHTDPQAVRLTTSGPGATPCWTATPSALGVLSVSPTSGCGSATITIGVSGFFPAGSTTTLFVNIAPSTNGDWTSQNIAVNVTGLTSSSGPTGSMDSPADGSTVSGSVGVTGWAMDDVEVTSIAICRDPILGETTTPGQCGSLQQVFIGNATFVDGARPDIQSADPTLPMNSRAGWGYLLLSNFLPNQGNVGPLRLYAWASDADGHTTLIGSKSVTANNLVATQPFGAIDTPTQGQTVCGVISNAGWVLTQRPKDIPADSSTITLFIDSVPIKTLDPGRLPRADVTALFSSTYDTSHAVGGTALDTTQFSNGVHTIFWVATDTGGQQGGIGSRFITISNPCGS